MKTSTTMTETYITAMPGSTLMTATIRLMVADANAFLAGVSAQHAVAAGIAAALGVRSTYITVVIRSARRLKIAHHGDVGASDVLVDYTATIPPSATAKEKAAASKDPSISDFNVHIQFKVAAATALSVDVQSKTSPLVSFVRDDYTIASLNSGCISHGISGLILFLLNMFSS